MTTEPLAVTSPGRPDDSASAGVLRRWWWRQGRDSIVFLPLIGLVGLMVVLPLGAVVFGALRTESPGAPNAAFTLQNVIAVYLGPSYLAAFANTFAIALPVTVLTSLIGFTLAWLLVRTDMPWARWLDIAVIVPQFLSPFTTTLAWIILASPRSGVFNVLLQRLGITSGPVFDVFSLAGIVWVMVLIFVPYVYLTAAPALRAMDPALEEASYAAGAGFWTTLRRVSLPLFLPTLFSSAFLVFIFSMEMFVVPALLGAPVRYYNLPYVVYSNTVSLPTNYGQAAAAGTMLLWLALVAGFVYQRLLRKAARFVTVTGKGYKPRQLHLGGWRWVATAFCVAYVGLGLVVPYVGLILGSFLTFLTPRITPEIMTLANYESLFTGPEVRRAAWNTLVLAVSGPTIGVILGLVLAFVMVRLPVPGRGLLDYLINLPVAVPAIVLGIGLLWVYAYLPIPLFGTILALVLAYQTRYLIFPYRTSTNGIVQIHKELEEAAQVAGASTWQVLRQIVAPLLAPALLAGWSVMFVLILREINMTIMLYTPSTQPIALRMWELTSNGNFTGAAALGVVQTIVIFVALFAIRRLTRTQTVVSG